MVGFRGLGLGLGLGVSISIRMLGLRGLGFGLVLEGLGFRVMSLGGRIRDWVLGLECFV